jgi:subtilisin-like proprotein convertase family protein
MGDLQVSLVSPQGTAIVLHNGEGGSTHDLAKS